MNDNPASAIIEVVVNEKVKWLYQKVKGRAYRASNELRTASLYVLRGQRSGRIYRVSQKRPTKHPHRGNRRQ